ncbi:hypothetical protein M199_gp082 [Halogranum tailed virus 1]|uniref:Uncharacterized protein n=1 Tax=Halogranum tailed virus 1 TaxID=1273749 RepID=R4T767_9CAUD|nr:hypothetical protein M199_gp082 [Halogranum tailed virus 1]AGM11584.1 hypothetical protein HGTV1_287 [Halogranum tailed virus 1]
MSEITYTNDEIRRAFKNRTFPGSNHRNSLNLTELPDGTFALLAYNWGKIADVSPEGEIRVFGGWADWAQRRFEEEYHGGGEATTRRHTRELIQYLLESGRDFEMKSTRPTVGTPPESLRELGHKNMIPNRTSKGRTE